MNRISSSWALIPLALVLCLHLACSTSTQPKTLQAPPGMVLIPGGTFIMGCTLGDTKCQGTGQPFHQVKVNAFYMDKTEVTVAAYRRCVEKGQCKEPRTVPQSNWGQTGRENHPVNSVYWNQAESYCKWIGKRLPSEAEWEYAARGGHDDWIYPWGNEKASCNRAVMNEIGENYGCGQNSTWPVGSKGGYGFGLEDMAGNVWEWVKDCWHDDYRGAPMDGSAWTTGCEEIMTIRGGSWADSAENLTVLSRTFGFPAHWLDLCGFRCAKSAE